VATILTMVKRKLAEAQGSQRVSKL
jgi:hypothetical protein